MKIFAHKSLEMGNKEKVTSLKDKEAFLCKQSHTTNMIPDAIITISKNVGRMFPQGRKRDTKIVRKKIYKNIQIYSTQIQTFCEKNINIFNSNTKIFSTLHPTQRIDG